MAGPLQSNSGRIRIFKIHVFLVVLYTLVKVKAMPGQGISTFEKNLDSGQIFSIITTDNTILCLDIKGILGSR